jgi:hypothetical protein
MLQINLGQNDVICRSLGLDPAFYSLPVIRLGRELVTGDYGPAIKMTWGG